MADVAAALAADLVVPVVVVEAPLAAERMALARVARTEPLGQLVARESVKLLVVR